METLPFHMDHVPEFFMKKCELELKETPENKVKSIEELRTMLKTGDKKISRVDFHEDLLVQYLRRNKYDVKKSFKHIQNCIALRKKPGNIFGSIPDEYFSSKISTQAIAVLPKRCPDGCTIIVFKLGLWNTNELPFEDFKRMAMLTFLQILRDPMNQINGFKFIHDFSGTSIHHLKYCTPQTLHLLYHSSLHCLPGRYKEIHCLQDSFVLKTLWTVAKFIVSEKN
ncbi:alpha-tocopherol transfer protein-like [Caerostris extrusa]|uniref:Alpha-tocopherol transfer protein-like n=1 Tax=Caerostris extrusa TaxID=172846 RepID=A0AAV4SJQ7_CAEEX|nr:alpha-tocopherol transfer protein-like [Caerostris extrusa]